MSTARRAGLFALAKCVVLLLGVPTALVRLLIVDWENGSPHAVAWAVRSVLAVAVLAWAVVASRLIADLVRALRGDVAHDGAWSRRWAGALVGLLLAASAGTHVLRASGSPPARAARAPAAATAPSGLVRVRLADAPPPPAPAAPKGPTAAVELAVLGLVGLGLVGATALTRRLALLRRLAECLRKPGEMPAPGDLASAWEEALLGPLVDGSVLEWVEGTNRLLWRSLREERATQAPSGTTSARPAVPDVTLMRVGPDGVELLLRSALGAPDGFVAADGGRRWVLDPAIGLSELKERTTGCGRYLPALLPIGDDGTASYLLPLGPGRRLVLEGSTESRTRVLAGFLVALRTLPWAEEIGVELIDIAPPPMAERSYQLCPSSYAELDALAARAAELPPADRLATDFTPSVLVVAAGELGDRGEETLARVGPAVGVLCVAGLGTDRLILDDKGAFLEPLGLSLRPARPTPGQCALIERLLAAAATPAVPAPAAPVAPATTRPRLEVVDDVEEEEEPLDAGPVEIRLLAGTPHLAGERSAAAPESARAIEVLAYLALHDHDADLEELRTSVFLRADGRTASLAHVSNVCSSARRALGRDARGRPYLPAASGGQIRLDRTVTVDAQRLVALSTAARHLGAARALDLLVAALSLVGPGAPVALRWTWFVAEGRDRALVAAIVDAAHHCAQLALATGDTARARWAVDVGRRAEPASEQLARDLLAICGEEGDRAGVDATFLALEETLESLAGGEPSLATRALHAALTANEPRPE